MSYLKIFFALFFFYTSSATALEFKSRESAGCPAWSLKMIGKIEKNDAIVFEKKLNEIDSLNKAKNCRLFEIEINSKGGSVSEAMKIGRIIRSRELVVSVPLENAECLSSCVLILGAGVTKLPNFRVGIHRPYFEGLAKDTSTAEIRLLRKQLTNEMKAYAEEMDLSERLIDDMMSTPPEHVKILTMDELDQYRLSGNDPSWDEKNVNDAAQRFGISNAEYRKRELEVSKRCPFKLNAPPPIECRESILWGMSQAEYLRKVDLVRAECVPKIPDHKSPAMRACILKIMKQGS